MLSEERKQQLISMLEYDVNKQISKQSVVYYSIVNVVENEEEQEFLEDLDYSFSVYKEN